MLSIYSSVRAYRILSNPITRRAYDAYGITGVEVIGGPDSGMSIVPRHRISDIEDIVAALLRERRRSALETDVACNAHVLAECDLWKMRSVKILAVVPTHHTTSINEIK